MTKTHRNVIMQFRPQSLEIFTYLSSTFFYSTSSLKANIIYDAHVCKQANSKNCGPPPGNKFDLGVGQRSRSRSLHGINRKGLSQGSCMPNINALSLILQKIWARLKFLWQRDWQTDRLTDEWVLISPAFAKGGGQ